MERVGFWRRVGAALIDILIIVLVSLLVIYLSVLIVGKSQFISPYARSAIPKQQQAEVIAKIIISLFLLTYSLMEVFFAGTLGKLLLGYRIGTVDGYKATKLRLLARFLCKNPTYIFSLAMLILLSIGLKTFAAMGLVGQAMALCLGLYNIINPLFALTFERQALHDIICGTAVFKGKLYSLKELEEMENSKRRAESETAKNNPAVSGLIFK